MSDIVSPGSWQDVLAHLMSLQEGEVRGALAHPELGAIDVKWGYAGTGKSDGFGLAKIVAFHPEVLDDLPSLLLTMRINRQRSGNNRVVLESERYKAIVSLDWHGQAQRWLLTAFRKRGEQSRQA